MFQSLGLAETIFQWSVSGARKRDDKRKILNSWYFLTLQHPKGKTVENNMIVWIEIFMVYQKFPNALLVYGKSEVEGERDVLSDKITSLGSQERNCPNRIQIW